MRTEADLEKFTPLQAYHRGRADAMQEYREDIAKLRGEVAAVSAPDMQPQSSMTITDGSVVKLVLLFERTQQAYRWQDFVLACAQPPTKIVNFRCKLCHGAGVITYVGVVEAANGVGPTATTKTDTCPICQGRGMVKTTVPLTETSISERTQ